MALAAAGTAFLLPRIGAAPLACPGFPVAGLPDACGGHVLHISPASSPPTITSSPHCAESEVSHGGIRLRSNQILYGAVPRENPPSPLSSKARTRGLIRPPLPLRGVRLARE